MPESGPAQKKVPLESAKKLREVMSAHYAAAKSASDEGRPVAWVTSGAPVELVYAAGIQPVYPENHAALCGVQRKSAALSEAAEERGYSRDLCSYARTDLGAVFENSSPIGGLPRPDLLVCCNNICGTVLKWYQHLRELFGVPLLVIDTPFLHDGLTAHARGYVRAQLVAMQDVIEQVAGESVESERLEEVLGLAGRAAGLWAEWLDCLRHRPAPLTAFDAFSHMAPIVVARGTQDCVDYYEALLEETRQRAEQGIAAVPGERFRTGWDNIPMWHALRPVSRRFEKAGVCMAAATYTSAWARMWSAKTAEDPYTGLAETYASVYLNLGMRDRADTLCAMVDDYALDGLVMHSCRSCRPYSMGQYGLARRMQDGKGIPVLVIESDQCDRRVYAEDAVMARIDAFVEALEARQQGRGLGA